MPCYECAFRRWFWALEFTTDSVTVDLRELQTATWCRRVTRSRISWGVQENQAMLSVNEVIARDPEVLGGTPVFRGTRVPFQALLDYLEGGQTLGEFLDDFPTVTRDAAISALEQGKLLLVSQLG